MKVLSNHLCTQYPNSPQSSPRMDVVHMKKDQFEVPLTLPDKVAMFSPESPKQKGKDPAASESVVDYGYDTTIDYGYEPIHGERYRNSPCKSEGSDGSLKKLFSSVNSLLTSRQTFTVMEGTTLETELDRLKRMRRRCSMTNAVPSTPSPEVLGQRKQRRNSLDNHYCMSRRSTNVSSYKNHRAQSCRNLGEPDCTSPGKCKVEYAEQKKKIHGFFEESNLPFSLSFDERITETPTGRRSGGYANYDIVSPLSAGLLSISPLSECGSASPLSTSSMSSISCSIEDSRVLRPPRKKALAGISVQRLFGAEDTTSRFSDEASPPSRDKAPRKPGRKRSILV